MKVIAKGMANWMFKPIRFRCPRCRCIFEAGNDEYTRCETRDDYGDSVYQYQAECPNCHKIVITVEDKDYDDN